MSYLIHTGLLLAVCFLYYRFLLRRETHFQLNRWLLIGCVALSFGLPLITVPEGWSFRKTAEAPIERAVKPLEMPQAEITDYAQPATDPSSSPLGADASSSVDYEAPAQATTDQSVAFSPIDWPRVILWIYLAGLLVFGLHFLVQIGALFLQMLRHPGHDLGDFRLVELDQNIAPYSFWNRIFLNPSQYDPDTYHQIVEHEQIHVAQKHSLDILLAELIIVVQWWNPFAWLYRSAIEHNLEFLTDAEMIRQGSDPVNYQMSLVRVAIPNHPQGLTSNYNQSFLEKRIAMMKTKNSSNRSAWKYLALLPLLLFSVLQLNAVDRSDAGLTEKIIVQSEPQVAAKVATPDPTPNPTPTPTPGPVVNPVLFTEPVAEPLELNTQDFSMNPMVNVTIDAKEISKMATKAASKAVMDIPEITNASRSWTAKIESNQVCFHFMIQSDHYMSTHNQCVPKRELGALPNGEMGTFTLTRYAGTMNFRGLFDGNEGLGTFSFEPAEQFTSFLAKEGYANYNDRELIHFFYADFGPEYLKRIRKLGYNPDKEELFKLMIFFDDQQELNEFISGIKDNGFNQPNLDDLISYKIHGISREYMTEMASIGYPDLNMDQLLEAKIHGMSADFMAEMKTIGFTDLTFNAAKEMAIHNISVSYVKELAAMGYTNLEPKQIVNAKIHGVSADFLERMKIAGFENLSLEEAKELSIHNISPEYAYELRQIGYTDLEPNELVNAKIHGVSAAQLIELKSLGYEDVSLDEAKQLAIHGVRTDYIRELNKLGLGELSLREIRNARIHNVSVDYIRRHRDEGDSLQDFIKMKIHGR
ncbi:hypothetical protein CEQ90_17290 [Lewinellaceae bacterium SD302]|nr:hypothetical protein CEQ90_17290 [Lewinellaceae bacterium SD302]